MTTTKTEKLSATMALAITARGLKESASEREEKAWQARAKENPLPHEMQASVLLVR